MDPQCEFSLQVMSIVRRKRGATEPQPGVIVLESTIQSWPLLCFCIDKMKIEEMG